MQLNVLDDLAEAMKAWTEKKKREEGRTRKISLGAANRSSPLSLRHGFVVVYFEVTICKLLCLDGLRHVISGILAGGIPGFRMVLLLLRSPSGMALWFWFSSLCFCCHTMSRWYNVITLALISPWTGTCHASVWLFCFGLLCFALFWWVCFWFLFSACGDFVTAYWTMRRSYTSSLLRPLNLQTAMYALIN